MSAIYRLKASEIDGNFLAQVKETFGEKEIEIVISEVDETEYLLKSEVNKNRLLKAIENIKNNRNLIEVNLDKLP
jgi:antitoxin YefM